MKQERRHLIIRTTYTTSREDDSCPHCGCRGRHITYVMCSDGVERGAMAGCIKKAFFVQGEFTKFERIERKYKEILEQTGRHWQNGLYELHLLENQIYDLASKYNKKAGIDAELPERLYSWEQIKSKRNHF